MADTQQTQTVEYRNWIPDVNRFNLERPPHDFLVALKNFDDMLVIIPSRKDKKYLITRRRFYTQGLGDAAMLDNKHPDTNMLYAHGLLPIAHLKWHKTMGVGSWTTETLFAQLRARDTWAITGGPTAVIKDAGEKLERLANMLDDADAAQEAKRRKNLWDDFYHRGRDAWRSMQARIGTRNKRASDHHGVASKPPSKQRVILTDAS